MRRIPNRASLSVVRSVMRVKRCFSAVMPVVLGSPANDRTML
jgi:hypothetical protein